MSFFKIIKFWFANNPILIVNKDFGLGEEGRWVVKEQLFTGFDFVEQPKWGYFLQTNNAFGPIFCQYSVLSLDLIGIIFSWCLPIAIGSES